MSRVVAVVCLLTTVWCLYRLHRADRQLRQWEAHVNSAIGVTGHRGPEDEPGWNR